MVILSCDRWSSCDVKYQEYCDCPREIIHAKMKEMLKGKGESMRRCRQREGYHP